MVNMWIHKNILEKLDGIGSVKLFSTPKYVGAVIYICDHYRPDKYWTWVFN